MINFIHPEVHVKFPWNYEGVENKYPSFLKQIEECGRICYQSFNKIDEKSAYRFVPHVIKRKHWSVTEFGSLDIKLNNRFLENIEFRFMFDDQFIKHSKVNWEEDILHTTLRDIYAVFDNLIKEEAYDALKMLLETIHINRKIENIKQNPVEILDEILPQLNDKKKFIHINPNEYDKEYVRFVTKFRSHLNFTHQLVRHRKPSYLQLSRRYVRVEDQLDVIDPRICYKNFTEDEFEVYKKSIVQALEAYKKLINNHKPEVARIALPTGIMTEILVLEYFTGWEWIWAQRTAPGADEMMRYIMALQLNILENIIRS